MKLRELISHLQRCSTWKKPNVELEQYPTPPEIAAHMLMAAEAEGDLGEDKLVADLGCGGGILGIGAACLGAEHVLLVDIDPKALEVAAENVEELEVPCDMLACDVTKLATSRRIVARQSKAVSPQAADASPIASSANSAADAPSLPSSFIESALPSRREYEASLQLSDAERIKLEGAAASALAALTIRTPQPAAVYQAPKERRPETDKEAGMDDSGDEASRSVGGGHFDCVLMNPPFGTRVEGVDMRFLRAGLELCGPSGAVYSLHKTSTRAFIKKRCAEWGCEASVVAELKFEIPKMYKHHRRASLDVDVDFWRVVPRRAGDARQ